MTLVAFDADASSVVDPDSADPVEGIRMLVEGGPATVNVNDWVVSGETPLPAVMAIGYVPVLPAAGVPDNVPVPSPLLLKLTPLGSAPDSEMNAVGLPVEVTSNVPLDPGLKLAWSPLVIAGASPSLMLADDSISGWAAPVKGVVVEVPIAVHADGAVHESARGRSKFGLLFGLGTTDHVDPFHDSIRVKLALLVL